MGVSVSSSWGKPKTKNQTNNQLSSLVSLANSVSWERIFFFFFPDTFRDCRLYTYSYTGVSVMYICLYLEDMWATGVTF